MTSQYHGGSARLSHGTESTPNQPSTALASPERMPLKIDIFQTRAATTYEQAVGRKNTDRKNACMTRVRATSSAAPSESTNVVGTMKTANARNVSRLLRNAGSRSMSR